MDYNEFATEQFYSLRREIDRHTARLFGIVVTGLLGLPFISYILLGVNSGFWIILPFFVLAMIVLFLAQQHQMTRAGCCMRQLLVTDVDLSPSLKMWIESRFESRLVDRHYSGCVIVLFFVFYFLSVALAMHRLWVEAAGDPSGTYWRLLFGAAGVYTITTICGLGALFHYWKSSTSTALIERET